VSDEADTTTRGAEANLTRYAWYVAGASFHAWMPVFFLYFTSRVTLSQAIELEAIYYACVVALELPSGYLSDRLGRARTLALSASMLCLAHALFATAAGFAQLAAAQALLAAAIAFNSGTDASFHLENLVALGRADEYAEREARLGALSLGASAGAALLGGVAGMWDLRLAYALSGAGALVALGAALTSSRPRAEVAPEGEGFAGSVRECVGLAAGAPLRWLFLAMAGATVVNHIPYEFYQPYFERLDVLEELDGLDATALFAGAHMAAAQLLGAAGARVSARVSARVGLVPHVLGAMALQVGLIGAMAWAVHPVVAVLLTARSLASALQAAPLRAAIAPRVRRGVRATYLSMQSLAGRLAFALTLLGLARAGDDLSAVLDASAALVLGVLVALLAVALVSPPPTGRTE
jgi:uncharacterized membrane protein YecN with MAPEG domain